MPYKRRTGFAPQHPGLWLEASAGLPDGPRLVEVQLLRGDFTPPLVCRALLYEGHWLVKLAPGDLSFSPLPAGGKIELWREVYRGAERRKR